MAQSIMQRSGPGSQRHALRSCYSSCPTGTCSYFCPSPVCTRHLPDNNLSCGMFFICTTLIPKQLGPCVNVNPKRRSIHSTSLLWIYEGSGLSPESSFDGGGGSERAEWGKRDEAGSKEGGAVSTTGRMKKTGLDSKTQKSGY